jgi:Ni,Fe-hydrogenase III small subunit
MTSLLQYILKTPVVTEEIKSADDGQIDVIARQIDARARKRLGRSLHIREVDAGSCNGCELEISALNNPYYDIERFGMHFVASPRHADCLLVTGPVTRNMADPLKRTYDATPDPKIVVAIGDCAHDCGVFAGGYGVVGAVYKIFPVDVVVRGCPPEPRAILLGILAALEPRK